MSERFSKVVIFVFYIFAALQLFFSYKSFRSGLDYLHFFRREVAGPRAGYAPFVTVIAPCKGNDDGLRENLNSLLNQDYPDYEVIFVVDDAADAAVEVIEGASREAIIISRLVISCKAVNSGQKVENLREAVLHANDASQVFVFADSDIRVPTNWLSALVAPLEDEAISATTGYRWFISPGGFNLAAALRSVWNASIASALGPDMKTNFCWGGSTAIRRGIFETLDIREKWRGVLSDDFALTRALNEAGSSIRFVPLAILPSFGKCSFGGLLEFTNRQMKITRVYSSRLWLQSFLGTGLYVLVMAGAILILFLMPPLSDHWIAAVVILLSVVALGTAKAALRLNAVDLALNTFAFDRQRQRIFHLTLWVVTPFLFLLNSTVALFSRRVRWRGISYEMVSPRETRVLERW